MEILNLKDLFSTCSAAVARTLPFSLFTAKILADLSFPRDNKFSYNSTLLNFTEVFYWIGLVPSDLILKIISCNVSLRVPMLKETGDWLSNLEMSLGEVFMVGFDVSYSVQHERLCTECNRLGGQCGFNEPWRGIYFACNSTIIRMLSVCMTDRGVRILKYI